MAIVALIPGFLAAYWVSRYGVVRAFLDVYLPVLLVFPDYFRFFMPGLPDPTMNQAAILPIAAGFFAKELRGWKFSTGDVLVLLFAYMCAYSEYRAKNYSEAQNLMFDMLTNVVLPYILTKGLVEAKGHRLEFAKRFVFLMTIVAFMMPYETKMTTVLIRIPLNPFFPGQGNWTPTGRWGLIRAAGPYGHAILAGIMMCVAYRFQFACGGFGRRVYKHLVLVGGAAVVPGAQYVFPSRAHASPADNRLRLFSQSVAQHIGAAKIFESYVKDHGCGSVRSKLPKILL